MQEIWEALEATAIGRKQGSAFSSVNASRRDTLNHRDYLLRFLEELDGELSVAEIREALTEYQG